MRSRPIILLLVLFSFSASLAFTAFRVESMERMEHPDSGAEGVFSTYAPYIIRNDEIGLGLSLEPGFPLWPLPQEEGNFGEYTAGMSFGLDGRILYPLVNKTENRYLLSIDEPELVWVDHRFHIFNLYTYLVGDIGFSTSSLTYEESNANRQNTMTALYALGGLRFFYQMEDSWCPYGEILLGVDMVSFTDESANEGTRRLSGAGFAISISGGIEYMLDDALALDGGITLYRGDFINQLSNDDGDDVDVLGRVFTASQLTLHLGVNYYL
ncbi:hypothetical protein K8R78_00215 [bacterium]|nr:hypothetical protein [bacterium]